MKASSQIEIDHKKEIKASVLTLVWIFPLFPLLYRAYMVIFEYPAADFYLKGEHASIGAVLMSGFFIREVIIDSLVISIIVTVLNHVIRIKGGLFIIALKLSFLMALTYFLYEMDPILYYYRRYVNLPFIEMVVKVIFFAGLFFVYAFPPAWLINTYRNKASVTE